ncbi:MAG TPA: thiol-disulfide oxidoreductase DCC family protein [Longimicrobiaceae bacterium]|nr:thiol-disulfide oxidoreductase DCC family protein [Longimicrobiaceae bacterium]
MRMGPAADSLPTPQGDAHTPPCGVVLFDGVCNLCNHSVQFILQHDPHGHFRFASLQSPAGQRLLREHGFPPGELGSVILVEGGHAYTRSDAALRIARRLSGAWPALAGLRVVPRFVRDRVYDWVAAHRYRWFGKREACMLPTPALRARFLD